VGLLRPRGNGGVAAGDRNKISAKGREEHRGGAGGERSLGGEGGCARGSLRLNERGSVGRRGGVDSWRGTKAGKWSNMSKKKKGRHQNPPPHPKQKKKKKKKKKRYPNNPS